MKIPAEILDILRTRVECDGNQLRIGGDRLNPRTYKQTNEVLEGAGGKWNKRVQAHIFPALAADVVAELLNSGEVTTVRERIQGQQYFPTPPKVVARLLELADVRDGMEVLEPSAGRGAIVTALAARGCIVDAVERDSDHAQVLKETGAARAVTVTDFLAVSAEARYDRVVMNPPFTRQADVAHVRHALGFLRPDGVLVSVMSQSTEYHRAAAEFRALVAERGGTLERLPDGSFKESGTGVNALIAVIPASSPAGDRAKPGPKEPADAAAPAMDGEELPSPEVLLQELKQNERAILRELNALERMLAPRPAAASNAVTQLTFDLGDKEVA